MAKDKYCGEVVTFRLHPDVINELDRIAGEGRVSRSEVLRFAIIEHLPTAEKKLSVNPFLYRD